MVEPLAAEARAPHRPLQGPAERPIYTPEAEMGSLKDDPHKVHSVEIFLFSNGQRGSPPRKYNVRVDDRYTTLNFLARSQSGSDHNIELYTTAGKKVGKALELGNGAAYVAVEPPQAFIPSDYNDYLMKASRSREKRHEKLPQIDSIMPDITNAKHETEELMKDGTNIKIIQDITIRPTSKTAVKEDNVATQKNNLEPARTAKPIGRLNNKQALKKNPQPNSNILRKNTNSVTPVKRKNNIPKVDAASKKFETSPLQNTKINPITKIIERFEKNSKGDDVAGVITIVKNNQENTDCPEAYDLLKHTDTTGEPSNRSIENKTPQLLAVHSMLIERNIMLPMSQENDLPKSATIPVQNHSKINLLLSSEPSQDIVPEFRESPQLRETLLSDNSKEIGTQVATTELTKVPNRSQKNATIFGDQTGDNNFTIYVKHTDVRNVMLNIEVKKISSSMFEARHSEPDVQDSAKNPAEAKSYREALTLTEQWRGHVSCEQLQILQPNDVSQGVCLCNCCSNSRTEGAAASIYVDNNNYFILLPPEDMNEQLLSCACKMERNQETKREIPNYHELATIKNHIISKLDGHNSSPTNTNDLNKNFESSGKDGDMNQCECCDCNQILDVEFPVNDKQTVICRNFVTEERMFGQNNPTELKDAITQTDWSGIVLEVRPGENGSYEFHIPSLKALKMADSLYK
ncbi:uncharacterized protein LOC125241820 [Leguminivora glycinivorella]|uniref:uncharacterized protein LOC125241820 n=1 Tax=Leguminivora glycinivorella TaxID=1035111 RepID=UPI00200CBE85|nr:uncharacterized protein LOC125241820 [Leguminivora glycinivorella]